MRNEGKKSKNKEIIFLVKDLPYFEIENLKGLIKKETYLKILLSRFKKKGEIFRLKKGLYVSNNFINSIEKKGGFSFYLEFLANLFYSPSYLSLEYVLNKFNALTEAPLNFTSISKKKTIGFSNKFGNFFYRKIKDELFLGFKVEKKENFLIYQASKAKALFDFIYLRKYSILNKKVAEELRINIEVFNKKDRKEIEKYIKLEGSKKMKNIFDWLFC
ncbi:MAG: hypothetical protein ABH808_01985 [Candidatus Kuenenbacteria bacterium]